MPDVIYIPVDNDWPHLSSRVKLRSKFISEGWKYIGWTELVDGMGTKVMVYILSRDVGYDK